MSGLKKTFYVLNSAVLYKFYNILVLNDWVRHNFYDTFVARDILNVLFSLAILL